MVGALWTSIKRPRQGGLNTFDSQASFRTFSADFFSVFLSLDQSSVKKSKMEPLALCILFLMISSSSQLTENECGGNFRRPGILMFVQKENQ